MHPAPVWRHPDRRRWGFQLTALNGNNRGVGTFALVDRKGVVRLYTPTRLSEAELSRRIEELLSLQDAE